MLEKCEVFAKETSHHVHFEGRVGVCCRCGKAWIKEAAVKSDCGPHANSSKRTEIPDDKFTKM